VRACLQGQGFIQKSLGKGDHLGTTQRIVNRTRFGTVLAVDHVTAIQGVIQGAPTGIGCIQGVPRVDGGHHQLRAGLFADLAVHPCGAGLNLVRWRLQVADGRQERAVRWQVGNGPGIGFMPGVQFELQTVAFGQ